jgi:hypothetical protein
VQKVVTRIKNRATRFYHPNLKMRQYVSSCESIRITGEILPPIIIFEGQVFLQKWVFMEIGLHDDIIVNFNDSEYMNDELSIDYIRYFDRFTKIYRVGAWRLLLSDGYGFYLHYDFIDYC